MKEVKDFQIKVRITKSEKEQISDYCEKHMMTISDLLRLSLEKFLVKED